MPVLSRRFSAVEEAFAYLESFTNLERGGGHSVRSYRLDRMHALLDHFGNPDRAFRTIHLAGSKGKGSTATFLASILEEAGRTTGLYTSPHVSDYRERITLAGHFFPETLYVEMVNTIAAHIAELDEDALPGRGQPTTFELLTLLGFLAFREWGCEWAVIETGIGGRLDATNVIRPEMCLLTPVELEHTELLGTTLRAIAGEKAGIIKEGVPVFASYQAPEVRDVFAATAALRHAPIRFLADEIDAIDARFDFESTETTLRWRDGRSETFHLSMPGDVQAENAALALLAIRPLRSRTGDAPPPPSSGAATPPRAASAAGAAARSAVSGSSKPGSRHLPPAETAAPSLEAPAEGATDAAPASRTDRPTLSEEAIRAGLAAARLPGRMEVIRTADHLVVLDGAHTPVSTSRLLGSFRKLFPDPAILIFGSVLGKDPEGMAAALAASFRSILISTPGTFKSSDPEAVHAIFRRHNPETILVPAPKDALSQAIRLARSGTDALPILVTGSFYMVSEIRKLLLEGREAH